MQLTHVNCALAGLALQASLEARVKVLQDLRAAEIALCKECLRDDTETVADRAKDGLRGKHNDGFLDHAACHIG